MKIVSTLLLCLEIFLNYIGSSSQSERLPNKRHHHASSQPTAESTPRVRSRSPTLRQTFPSVLGFIFEDVELIRLRPRINPDRIFKLQRYVFPPDERIGLRAKRGVLSPIPSGEQIVLSTANGDVCAILDKTLCKHTILRAICTRTLGRPKRVKININSGAVEGLTEDEIAECPVSTHEQVAKSYELSRSSLQAQDSPDGESNSRVHDYGSSPSSPPPSHTRSSTAVESSSGNNLQSPSLRETFPNVFGYIFDDLAFIRLIPHDYPNRIFELRIYAFPSDKPIGLRTKHHGLRPMPTGDQIVLSEPNGDVYAILQKGSNRCSMFRPILTAIRGFLKRVKINMNGGVVAELTKNEIAECPVNPGNMVTKSYRVLRVERTTLYRR